MIKVKAVLALTAAFAFLLSPFLSSGFNGFTATQFPIPQVDAPVQPAGYAFSIWGLIYLWLLAGSGFGLLFRDTVPEWDAMRWPYIASLTIGAAWIPVAQLSPVWATILIWVMWAMALAAFLLAGTQDRLWLRTPIALYLGWLTAASCVSLGLVLAGYGVLSSQIAAIVMILLALVLSAIVLRLRRDTPEFAVSVIWALIGVMVANAAPANWVIVLLSAAGVAALGLQSLRRVPSVNETL
ncbi:MAG: hypothetical protein AAFW87_00270 [Pseudomonadota bacterium]